MFSDIRDREENFAGTPIAEAVKAVLHDSPVSNTHIEQSAALHWEQIDGTPSAEWSRKGIGCQDMYAYKWQIVEMYVSVSELVGLKTRYLVTIDSTRYVSSFWW